MKKLPSKPVPKPVVQQPLYASVDLTDQEIGYILLALNSDIDANPEVILPLMARLSCYLASEACTS